MNTAEINNIRKNIMGTTSFEMKAAGMRKAQDFTVYPIGEGDKTQTIRAQSDNYWAEIDTKTGIGEISARHSHANGWEFNRDKITGKTKLFKLSGLDLETLRLQIFTSANKEAGKKENSIVHSDNSGAINILDI